MARDYRPIVRDQQFLLPPDMGQWLPEDHLVWFVLDVVDALDTSAFHADRKLGGAGRRSYDPDMMLALLVYSYANGVHSSRRIERLCIDHVAYRVLCGQDGPDHSVIARFRARNESAFEGLFTQVLQLCATEGMLKVGMVAIDGTKIAANASRNANRSHKSVHEQAQRLAAEAVATAAEVDEAEDAAAAASGGDDARLPAKFAARQGRVANLKKALEEIAAQDQARTEINAIEAESVRQYLDDVEHGRIRAAGRRAGVDPADFARARITYHQSRIDALAGQRGLLASNQRRNITPLLVRAQRLLDQALADQAAGIAPDLRSKSERHRVSRAKARGSKSPHVNLTDPQSRLMTEGSGGGTIQGYNAQFAVTDNHYVLAVHVSQNANDAPCYDAIMAETVSRSTQVGADIGTVVMDAGYFSEASLTAPGPDRLIAAGKNRDVHKHAREYPAHEPPPPELSASEAMRHRLRQPENIEKYKRRGATVEPVFGHLKERVGLRRFVRRGLPAVTAELNLAASVLNLLRLHNLNPAT